MPASSTSIMDDARDPSSPEHGVELVCLKGTSKARGSPRTSRILRVDFDPTVTGLRQFLGTLVRHGFDARIVGMCPG